MPLLLFGHSMGAIVAFELAHALRGLCHQPVVGLVAAASEAPLLSDGGDLCILPDADLAQVVEERWGGFPDGVAQHAALRASILALLRADLSLLATCRKQPEPQLDVPLLILRGAEDHSLPESHYTPWRGYTSAGCEFLSLPGDHMFPCNDAAAVLRAVFDRFPDVRATAPSNAPRPGESGWGRTPLAG